MPFALRLSAGCGTSRSPAPTACRRSSCRDGPRESGAATAPARASDELRRGAVSRSGGRRGRSAGGGTTGRLRQQRRRRGVERVEVQRVRAAAARRLVDRPREVVAEHLRVVRRADDRRADAEVGGAAEDVAAVPGARHPAEHDRAGVGVAVGDVLADAQRVALRRGTSARVQAVGVDVGEEEARCPCRGCAASRRRPVACRGAARATP